MPEAFPVGETVRFEDSYRPQSEDHCAILPLEEGILLVVADGVGGRPGGGVAAEMAVQLVGEGTPALATGDHRMYQRLVGAIDEALAQDETAGETTLVIVGVTPKRLVGISVGDSEAWLVTPEGRYDLTGGQQRKPYLGHGMSGAVPFDMPNPGTGTLVVATDGLFKYALPERIEEEAIRPDLDEALTRVTDLARLGNGRFPDDIAVLLCRLNRPGRKKANFLQRLWAASLPSKPKAGK